VPEWLRLGGALPDAGDRFGGHVQARTDQGSDARPDSLDRIAEHGAGRCTEDHPPDQRIENSAPAATSGPVRAFHDRKYPGVGEVAVRHEVVAPES
jgi:hypothetical protein